MFTGIYNDLVNILSFDRGLRELRSKINISIDLPDIIAEFPDSHPRGFIKVFRKRRTTIAEAYLRITKSLDSANYNHRIRALRLLAEHITYSRSLKMPLNAARVQLAIMKEVVNSRDDKRKQLELMRDFTISSFGQERSIRRFLKKFDIIEVPETGEELRDLKMGWDFHVHDNTSYGLKTPIQLIIDAFIKGISELTIVYNNFEEQDAIKEILEAGKILGIKVNIALEFSAINEGLRFHYMYILPEFSSKKGKFKKFLKQTTEDFKNFLTELEENERSRRKNIRHLIRNFNSIHLSQINEGYVIDSQYYLHPLKVDFDDNPADRNLFSRRQLGEFLYPKLKAVLEKRALHITALKTRAEQYPDLFSKKETEHIFRRYDDIRNQYRDLEPEKLRELYFQEDVEIVNESAVSDLHEIYKLAKRTGAYIKFIQPLEHGLQQAVNIIFENHKMLSHTEVFNAFDNIGNKEPDYILFARVIRLINEADYDKIIKFLDHHQVKIKKSQIEGTLDHYKHDKLIPALGSDATGRSTLAPGMGFIMMSQIAKRQRKYFENNHHKLPDEISYLVYRYAKVPKVSLKKGEKPDILCLGKQGDGKKHRLGDEKDERAIPPLRVWEYLNPAFKNMIFILIGIIPAYYILGIEFAVLWFVITGSRNMFVDVISGKGFNIRRWHIKDVNWTNVAQSLFFTGFSVPILGFVKTHFDILYTGVHEGTQFELVKFFFINITNGLYIATHNYIRGFDKTTVRANFFRSIMAWPLSAAFAPVGNLLLIPSIVQAKFWSDFVAAIIEGTAKYRNIISVKNKEMKNLLPDLVSEDDDTEILALLDTIYFMNESKRSRTALINYMVPSYGVVKRMKHSVTGKKKKWAPNELFFELKQKVDEPGKFEALTDFIIRHYKRDQCIYLLNLTATQFPRLRKFLDDIQKSHQS